MNEPDDDIAAAQAAIRRGGSAYLVHVVGLGLGVLTFFGAPMVMGSLGLLVAGGLLCSSGVGAIIGKRTVLPLWLLSFLLSWVVTDRAAQERVLAYVAGGLLIFGGLGFAALGILVRLMQH